MKEVRSSIRDFARERLDVIVDFAGFGTTTAEAIETVGQNGRVVQVGMGKLEATISTKAMILKRVTLAGSNGGTPDDVEGIYSMLSAGELKPVLKSIPLEAVADGLDQLHRGEVTGRLVACP